MKVTEQRGDVLVLLRGEDQTSGGVHHRMQSVDLITAWRCLLTYLQLCAFQSWARRLCHCGGEAMASLPVLRVVGERVGRERSQRGGVAVAVRDAGRCAVDEPKRRLQQTRGAQETCHRLGGTVYAVFQKNLTRTTYCVLYSTFN